MGNPRPTVAQHCAKAKRCVHDDQTSDKLQKGWIFRVGTWNVDSLTGRAGEVMKVLGDGKVYVVCEQQMRWMELGCRYFDALGKAISCFDVDVRSRVTTLHTRSNSLTFPVGLATFHRYGLSTVVNSFT